MVIAFAILGLIVGAGIGEFWGAAIGCAAGAWLGHWLKKTKPPVETAQATFSGAETPLRDAAFDHGDPALLKEEVRSLSRRVAHLESEIVRLGGSAMTVASAAPAMPVEPVVAPAPVVEERPIAAEPVAEPAPAVAFEPTAFTHVPEAAAPPPPPAEPNAIWKWLTGGN